jgi:hypothetical protein
LVYQEQFRVKIALRGMGGSWDWKYLFVEGFLLFTAPTTTTTTGDDAPVAATREEKEALEFQKTREDLVDLFDIKLFLPATKEDAKTRRFGRKNYRDIENGGLRLPGQMWRSEGYFEDVAWAGYKSEYKWLLEDGGAKDRGVDIWLDGKNFEGEVESIAGAVKWAVGVILERLGNL